MIRIGAFAAFVIFTLASVIEWIYCEQVSRWLWKQWASDKPYEAIKYATEHHVHVDRVPMTFVALLDE
ncbi:hypothetical protein [Paenibacillus alvei]|nr:hypothetical protein [Paenibacillus alvei]